MARAGTDRRSLLIGGACLVAAATEARLAAAQGTTDYAVFAELSPEPKKMKDGWNRRIFTNTDVRKGNGIPCDFANGIVTPAPGADHLAGYSMVAYFTGSEPPETTTTRSPASPGYCRLRKVAADEASGTLDMHPVDNGDPTALCIGSPSSANLVPSLFATFYESDRPVALVREHQSGSKPEEIYLRVFVENSKWHAFARLTIQKL